MATDQVRMLMKEQGIDAYVVYCADQHNSEYTGVHDKKLGYVCGFTGSAGTGLITQDAAYLWTDGRYFIQANRQLKDGWKLMEMGMPNTPTIAEYINKCSANQNYTVGFNVHTTSALEYFDFKAKLWKKITMKLLDEDLVSKVWGEDRPKQPANEVYVHPMKYAGYSTANKIKDLQADLEKNLCDAMVISYLDEVAYVMNLRGSDVICNPLFYGFLMITKEGATIYMNKDQLNEEAYNKIKEDKIEIKPYTSIAEGVKEYSDNNPGAVFWLDPRTTLFIYNSVNSSDNIYLKTSPVPLYKAIKNEAELESIRQSHIRDGIAHIRFFQWLENVKNDGTVFTMTEDDLADKITYYRSIEEGYLFLGFATISAIGVNASLAHYNYPKTEQDDTAVKPAIYLLDSGTQYIDGTCDITRTVHLGEPTHFEKLAYTLVLKGHIQLALAIFPENTKGPHIDALARLPLWKAGLNYIHGTGHGLGAALSAHEGPMKLDVRLLSPAIDTNIVPNMVLTNEPGYYDEDEKFGIRIENTIFVVDADTPYKYAGLKFYGFETISYIPIDTEMIITSQMTQEEIDWFNAYHEKVFKHLNARLEYEESTKGFDNTSIKAWLKEKTQPIYK